MERGAAAAAAALGCALRSPSPSPSPSPQWTPLLRCPRRSPYGAPRSLLPPAGRFRFRSLLVSECRLHTYNYFSQNRLLHMKKGKRQNFFKTFSSSEHAGVSLNNADIVNDKLLIDCGEEQDCVLGKFYIYNLHSIQI
ncbi:hypothetical protein PR202_gb10601 [Eleusine coracana subsp. coracana]|uniref:Uncharacterized protein n=1 Tax=Eleusine coracana subsp. coracana TaxID=191504 RepID=A0AAV5EKX5_ELECO|nr:hypothetical protein PR202_gb10601 [Eleusine coracana subsp. coracana]